MTAIVISIVKLLSNPTALVNGLGNVGLALVLIASSLGILLFPAAILALGVYGLPVLNSKLNKLYWVILIVAAIASVPIACFFATACAWAMT